MCAVKYDNCGREKTKSFAVRDGVHMTGALSKLEGATKALGTVH